MLSKKHVKDICLYHSANYKTCRYCAVDELDSSKFYCLKQSSNKVIADAEIKDFLKKMKKANQDPKNHGLPLGDNCPGYPILKYVEQGYDKDK